MPLNPIVVPGGYHHFKGNYIHIVDCQRLEGTRVWFVIYFPLVPGGEKKWYYREAKEFTEIVNVDGEVKPRFQRIS